MGGLLVEALCAESPSEKGSNHRMRRTKTNKVDISRCLNPFSKKKTKQKKSQMLRLSQWNAAINQMKCTNGSQTKVKFTLVHK